MIAYYLFGGYLLLNLILFIFGILNLKRIQHWYNSSCWILVGLSLTSILLSCLDVFWITPFRTVHYLLLIRFPVAIVPLFSAIPIFTLKNVKVRNALIVFHLLWSVFFPFFFIAMESLEMAGFELLIFSPIFIGTWDTNEVGGLLLIQLLYALCQIISFVKFKKGHDGLWAV